VVTLGPTDSEIGKEDKIGKRDRFFTEYERTKYLAEARADRLAKSGLPLVTVLPTRVYGPGKMTEGNAVTIMMRRYIKGRFPFILNKGREVGNYAYVDDVVDGHIRAMSRGRIGQKYILGGENCSVNEFFSVLSKVSKRRPIQFRIPPRVAGWVGTAEEIRARITGSYPLISRGWISTFLQNWAYSSDKATSELGYRYRGIQEGIRLTYDWLLKERLV
jgi:farnesol dehydrogenase